MTSTAITHRAIPGPSSSDRSAWLAARRGGITATEVRDCAKGNSTDRRRIIAEKVTGTDTPDLSGNRHVAYGHEREPFIANWIQRRFGIEPSTVVYAHPEDPRLLATADGYSIDPMTEENLVAEIKTSKHDLWPLMTQSPPKQGERVLTVHREVYDHMRALGGKQVPHFWSTGYYDQMQWQMFVMGAERVLFVYEQHDDQWPSPSPLGEPIACWIERNPKRISELIEVAKDLLSEVERARVSDLPQTLGTIPAEIADDVHQLLEYRNAEALAKTAKEAVWKRIGEFFKDKPATTHESDEAKVTWSPTKVEQQTTWADPEDGGATAAQLARIAKAREAVAKAEASVKAREEQLTKAKAVVVAKQAALDAVLEPWRTVTPVVLKVSSPLTVTAKRTTTKED